MVCDNFLASGPSPRQIPHKSYLESGSPQPRFVVRHRAAANLCCSPRESTRDQSSTRGQIHQHHDLPDLLLSPLKILEPILVPAPQRLNQKEPKFMIDIANKLTLADFHLVIVLQRRCPACTASKPPSKRSGSSPRPKRESLRAEKDKQKHSLYIAMASNLKALSLEHGWLSALGVG